MSPRNHRLACLGLLGTLGLVAFIATAAQSEPGPAWMINGKNILANLLPEVEVKEVEKLKGTEEKHLVLLSKILGAKFEVLCTGMTFPEAILKAESTSSGSARFTGCITKLNGTTSAPCEPRVGTEKGVIVTKPLKALIVLHTVSGGGTIPVVLVEPAGVTAMAVIQMSSECAAGEMVQVIGRLYAEDSELQEEETTHLFKQNTLGELWVNSKTAEHVATIDGSVVVELTGSQHHGMAWSGLPS
jgi:hypothetical protein